MGLTQIPEKKKKSTYTSKVVKREKAIPPAKNNNEFKEIDINDLIKLFKEKSS